MGNVQRSVIRLSKVRGLFEVSLITAPDTAFPVQDSCHELRLQGLLEMTHEELTIQLFGGKMTLRLVCVC